MSNNVNSAKKALETAQLNGIQLVLSEKNPLCVCRVLYKGIESSSVANYNKDMFESLFLELKQCKDMAEIKAIMTGSSVATLKVNKAHGRRVIDETVNFIEQDRTYCTNDGQYQFIGQTLSECVETCMRDNLLARDGIEMFRQDYFIKRMKNMHNVSTEKAIELVRTLLNKKDIYICCDKYIGNYKELYKIIKNWHGQNDKPITTEQIDVLCNKYIKKYEHADITQVL